MRGVIFNQGDVERLRQRMRKVEVTPLNLLAMAKRLFRGRFQRPAVRAILTSLEGMDRALLATLPRLRRYGGEAVVVAENDKTDPSPKLLCRCRQAAGLSEAVAGEAMRMRWPRAALAATWREPPGLPRLDSSRRCGPEGHSVAGARCRVLGPNKPTNRFAASVDAHATSAALFGCGLSALGKGFPDFDDERQAALPIQARG